MLNDKKILGRDSTNGEIAIQGLPTSFDIHDDRSLQSLKVYTEFKIAAANRSWKYGDNAQAIRDFKMASQACFLLDDPGRGISMLDKVEIIRAHQELHEDVHDAHDKYLIPLEQKVAELLNKNDRYQSINVLLQAIGISKAAGFTSLTRKYKKMLTVLRRSLVKKDVVVQPREDAVRVAFAIAVKLASERKELAFMQSNRDRLQLVEPILVTQP